MKVTGCGQVFFEGGSRDVLRTSFCGVRPWVDSTERRDTRTCAARPYGNMHQHRRDVLRASFSGDASHGVGSIERMDTRTCAARPYGRQIQGRVRRGRFREVPCWGPCKTSDLLKKRGDTCLTPTPLPAGRGAFAPPSPSREKGVRGDEASFYAINPSTTPNRANWTM